MFIPLVEDVETVSDALNNFYFPPLGNRSWGGNLMVAKFGVGEVGTAAVHRTAAVSPVVEQPLLPGYPDREFSCCAEHQKPGETGY